MAHFFDNSNERRVLADRIYLVQGSSRRIKVHGLSPEKKPIIIKISPPGVVELKQNIAANAKTVSVEQNITIKAIGSGVAVLHGYISTDSPTALSACTPDKLTGCISPLKVEVLTRIELPPINSEEGIIARMLIAESITPKGKGFTSLEDSIIAMQWMRIALENRLTFSHPQLLQVSKGVTGLSDLIKTKGVIEGFDSYPNISGTQKDTINGVINSANDASLLSFQLYRGYVQNALDVATNKKRGIDPCPTKIYFWRTIGSNPPGGEAVAYKSFGGQVFYTLSPSFLADPLQRAKK